LILTRWGRYLIAGLVLGCAVLVVVGAIVGTQTHTTSGTVGGITRVVDKSTGTYTESILTLEQESTRYRIDTTQFTPALTEEMLRAGIRVDMWYTQAPLNDPYVVAVRFASGSGTGTTQFVTNAYLHPDDVRTSNYLVAAIFAGIGIIALAAA